jgi:hypothetical protein
VVTSVIVEGIGNARAIVAIDHEQYIGFYQVRCDDGLLATWSRRLIGTLCECKVKNVVLKCVPSLQCVISHWT